MQSRLLDDEHHWGDYLPRLWQSFQRCKCIQETLSTVLLTSPPKYVDGDDRNFHLTRNSLMSPWPVRMVRWWKPTKWSWLAPVTNEPSLASKGWGFLKCFGRTEECWLQNWGCAWFLLATLYTSWTVCDIITAAKSSVLNNKPMLKFHVTISSLYHYQVGSVLKLCWAQGRMLM